MRKGERPPVEAIAERLQWWDELFEPPCVGFAASREEAGEFAAAGADFVLVGDFIWADPRGAAGGADRSRAGDQAGARARRPEKPRPSRDNAGNEAPASHIDPRELPDAGSRRVGAGLADASAAQRRRSRPRRTRRQGSAESQKRRPRRRSLPRPPRRRNRRQRRRRRPPRSPAPAFEDPNVDLVYGAYQRGMYKTAFDLATTRAQYNGDPKAMTMLGELYANAMGVKRDYAKAAEWYKRAADAGDREGHVRAGDDAALPAAAARSTARKPSKLLASVGQARQPQGGL